MFDGPDGFQPPIPADVLSPILQTLIAKELKFIQLTGSKFRYRSARLTGLRLEMCLTETTQSTPPRAESWPAHGGA
jgi:hypothetical protein